MLKTLLSLLPLAHISFLFTSSACTVLCFLSLPYRISHWKSLYMPKKYLDTSDTRHKRLSERKACSSLFLGTNNKGALPSMVEFKLWLVLRHRGCYRCSFVHLIIEYVFNNRKELNRARHNTAVLMLINVWVTEIKEKS